MTPLSSLGSTKAPPAPSPKRTQVALSVQSTIFESVSAPKTRTFLYRPLFTNLSATLKAYTKPEQAALKSKAQAFTQPKAP